MIIIEETTYPYSDDLSESIVNDAEDLFLSEGTHYGSIAAERLANSGLFDEATSREIVDRLMKRDIHAFVHSDNYLKKYIKGIIRMLIEYSNGDASKAIEFLEECSGIFDDYLTYVKDNHDKMGPQLDDKFINKMSYQDVKDELETIQAERDAQSKEELSKMKFSESSNFELVPIESYDELHSKFGGRATGDGSSDKYAGEVGGTAWCHTNSRTVYDDWVKDGKRKFFILANKNWKNIPFDPQSNEQDPKDAYGNSLIALLVGTKTGTLINATLRCNHVGVSSNADKQYRTYAELSKVAGFNVEDTVMEFLQDSLVDTSNIWDTFDGSAASLDDILEVSGVTRDDLTSIVIPNDVEEIGDNAFRNCNNLKSVMIPDSVKSIGHAAFYECISLTSITIPNSVKDIGDWIFAYCGNLKSVILPDRVSGIGECAFYFCNSLTSITIPDRVVYIGKEAFSGCDSLKSVTIPDKVTYIDDMAFNYCRSLELIALPDSIKSIGDGVFRGCENLDREGLRTYIQHQHPDWNSEEITQELTRICDKVTRDDDDDWSVEEEVIEDLDDEGWN